MAFSFLARDINSIDSRKETVDHECMVPYKTMITMKGMIHCRAAHDE